MSQSSHLHTQFGFDQDLNKKYILYHGSDIPKKSWNKNFTNQSLFLLYEMHSDLLFLLFYSGSSLKKKKLELLPQIILLKY